MSEVEPVACQAHRLRYPEPDGRKMLPGVCVICGFVRESPSGIDAWPQWSGASGVLGIGELRDPRWERERARGAPKEKRRG